MRRIITIALCLASLGGVASADRGPHRGHAPTVRDHRSGGVSLQPSRVRPSRTYVQPSRRYVQPRVYHNRGNFRVVHRPIFVRHRPVIRYRYYNYYQRPSIIVENPRPLAGYYWVNGSWQWNGAEWVWMAGHYEPDPNWGGDYYQPGYDSDYYYGTGY